MNENYIFQMERQIRRLQLENEMLNNLLSTSLGNSRGNYDNLILREQNRQLKEAVAGLKDTINGLEMLSRMPLCPEIDEAKIKMAPCQQMNSTLMARSRMDY